MIKIEESPRSGEHILRFRGDCVKFTLSLDKPARGRAFVRTNLGNAPVRRAEVISHVETGAPYSFQDWRDIPMSRESDSLHTLSFALTQTGHFEAKCFLQLEDDGGIVWPAGNNIHINVEPAEYRCANTIYCAFVRQFGENKNKAFTEPMDDAVLEKAMSKLDDLRYTVIPPSGTFRDLARQLGHIVDSLKCRIIHLLPINPTPTVYARMGRFGSPYAALDFMSVDPSLAEFDKKATPLDQFLELANAVHRKNARLFLDIAVNHTGWAAKIHEEHPEWLMREEDGSIHSPGAWGVVWGDLTELDKSKLELWKYLGDMFLVWCSRGVDGFRCDAGYMIPEKAWEYIIARVRDQYPDVIFLLEGLGGDPAVTSRLLDTANMNWAYSELFQNYTRQDIESYLTRASKASLSDGVMAHYAETHDNNRLAATSKKYAMMRTALCALSSSAGTFGFTNGVEWFAQEKIDVHKARGLNWGSHINQVNFISRLNSILISHPAFHGASPLSFIDSGAPCAVAFTRGEGSSAGNPLVLINLDCAKKTVVKLPAKELERIPCVDLISGEKFKFEPRAAAADFYTVSLEPGQVLCLTGDPADLKRAEETDGKAALRPAALDTQSARASVLEISAHLNKSFTVFEEDIDAAAAALLESPEKYLDGLFDGALETAVTVWSWPHDTGRMAALPPGHFLLIKAPAEFRARIISEGKTLAARCGLRSSGGGYFTLLTPFDTPAKHTELDIKITVCPEDAPESRDGKILLLSGAPAVCKTSLTAADIRARSLTFLAANKRGAFCRPRVRWGEIRSRYDALLLANLAKDFPEDRHIMLRRFRMWLVFRGRSQELNADSSSSFVHAEDGSGVWTFRLPGGNGVFTEIQAAVSLVDMRNAVKLRLSRQSAGKRRDLTGDETAVTLIVRPDIEDRNFHFETKAFTGPEKTWPSLVKAQPKSFSFAPCADRELLVSASKGAYKPAVEWCYSIHQDAEASRGLEANSDLFSPGYFEVSLAGGESVDILSQILTPWDSQKIPLEHEKDGHKISAPAPGDFESVLRRAMAQFVVNREGLKTVIAGYPWFLDWGRDTFIAARGLAAAGMLDDVKEILLLFARFADRGTLPNMIHGGNAANRDTSDAPLWFFTVCADIAAIEGSHDFLKSKVSGKQTLLDVLESIAEGFMDGAPNGIKADPESSLVFSPAHFTWMDTNYPAATPREGYPIEIQCLWFAALKLLAAATEKPAWEKLAAAVKKSVLLYYPLKDKGFFSDCLHSEFGVPASRAVPDDHLRPNQLLAVTLGLADAPAGAGDIIRSSASLLIPGAIRSLADLDVDYPLPVYGKGGGLLNDPKHPYWGVYEGPEDTQRKPAYHNGTAWTWQFPLYAEALFKIRGERARKTALALLSSSETLLNNGCLGQIPEIVDGSLPHKPRGCDAQAWGVTELFRVWKMLA